MRFVIKALLLMPTLLIGCRSEEQQLADNLAQALTGWADIQPYQAVWVIPSSGCTGCINEAEKQMFTLLKSQKPVSVCFVLTDYRSRKEVRVKFSDKIFRYKNVQLDTLNRLFKHQAHSIYPIVYLPNQHKARIITPSEKLPIAEILE